MKYRTRIRLMLVRVADEGSETVINALIKQAHKLGRTQAAHRGRTTAERAAQRNAQLRNTDRTLYPMRCVDRLNPQPEADMPVRDITAIPSFAPSELVPVRVPQPGCPEARNSPRGTRTRKSPR